MHIFKLLYFFVNIYKYILSLHDLTNIINICHNYNFIGYRHVFQTFAYLKEYLFCSALFDHVNLIQSKAGTHFSVTRGIHLAHCFSKTSYLFCIFDSRFCSLNTLINFLVNTVVIGRANFLEHSNR